jgi:hypothetical protein
MFPQHQKFVRQTWCDDEAGFPKQQDGVAEGVKCEPFHVAFVWSPEPARQQPGDEKRDAYARLDCA